MSKKLSFEKARKKMLEQMIEASKKRGEEIITKVIPFRNDDVPNFLREFNKWIKESEKSKLRFKNYNTTNNYIQEEQYAA